MHPRRFPLLKVLLWVAVCVLWPGSGRAETVPSMGALSAEVDRLSGEVRRNLAAQRQEEALAARESEQIERLKELPEGVTRDLQLQEKLARAQSRAVELSQRSALLRQQMAQLRTARQRLIQTCDRALADGPGQQMMAAQRLEILRLRAAQVEALLPEGSGQPLLLGSAVRAAEEAQPDDPTALRERADLLRDSEDKVRREILRLSQRAEELQHRRHLRERAAQVDEDLFAEQVSSRRPQQNRSADTAQGAAAPPPTGPVFTPGPGPQVQAPPPAPVHSGLDPATLDLLRRSDASADPEVKLSAMRRAQGELQKLADELKRRATTLDRRADELRRRK